MNHRLRLARDIAIGLTIGVAALGIAALGFDLWTDGSLSLTSSPALPPTPTPIAITIGSDRLMVPANYVRFSSQRRPGVHDRLDLALLLPELAGVTADTADKFTSTAKDGHLVFITLSERDTELDTVDRMNSIYRRYLNPEMMAGPGGLARRKFLPNTSYDGEELNFELGTEHPFAARCFPLEDSKPVIVCLRDVRLGTHLLATIRFPYAVLEDWREFATRLDRLLASLTAPT